MTMTYISLSPLVEMSTLGLGPRVDISTLRGIYDYGTLVIMRYLYTVASQRYLCIVLTS